MSKQASKEHFEWYAKVAEKRLNKNYSYINNFFDCKTENEFKDWFFLINVKYYGLRCTCDECMDWKFNNAEGHYHSCDLYKFTHTVNRCIEWYKRRGFENAKDHN